MVSFINYLKSDEGKVKGLGAIFAGFSAMFSFMGYELMRSSSESIFLSSFSASDKVYALALTPIFLMFIIYAYGFTLSKLGSRKTMIIYFGFVIFSLSFFYFFSSHKISFAAFSILVFKEAYVVVLSEMYWSYINSVIDTDEAKIINGPVAGLGALGSVIGGYIVSRFAVKFSSETMILFSSLILFPAVLLFVYSYKLTGEPKPSEDEAGGKKGHLHFSILFENKVLIIMAIMVFLSQIVSTLSDLNFTGYVKSEIPDKDLRTAYLGGFWTRVNIVSFTMQFLITPLILKRVKIKYVLFFIPLIHLSTSFYSFIHPSLFSASLVFLVFKSMDYSIYRASKEILYIPFSYDTRYRAKQIVDAFTYRFSKGFTSSVLSVLNIASVSYYKFIIPMIMIVSVLWSLAVSGIKEKDQ